MIIVLFLFLIIINRILIYGKNAVIKAKTNYVFIFLIIGLLIDIIFTLLNYTNPIPFADISDAGTYVQYGIRISEGFNNIFLKDNRYWGYGLILSLIYKTSFNNMFFYVLSASYINFLLIGFLFLRIIKFEKNNLLKLSTFYFKILLFNPGIILISISTTRDIFIFYLVFNIFLNIFFNRNIIISYIGVLFMLFLLYLFRDDMVPVILVSVLFSYLLKYFFKKITYIQLALMVVVIFFLIILIIPPNISGARSLLLSVGSDIQTANEKFGPDLVVPVEDVYSLNNKQLFRFSSLRFIKRAPFSFFGGSYIKNLYVNLSGYQEKVFYNTNFLKYFLEVIYQLYKYIIFFPILLYFIFHKVNWKDKYLVFSFFLYFIIFTSYTIMQGSFQNRIRILPESIVLFSFFVYIGDKNIKLSKEKMFRLILITNLIPFFWVLVDPL